MVQRKPLYLVAERVFELGRPVVYFLTLKKKRVNFWIRLLPISGGLVGPTGAHRHL